MKRFIYIVLLVFISIVHSFAQNISPVPMQPVKAWKISGASTSFGIDWDCYPNMSLRQLQSFAENPEVLNRDLTHMEEEVNTTAAGGVLSTSISLTPLKRSTGQYKTNQQLQLGVSLYTPKEAMVTYRNENLDTSVVFCNIHSELALEGAYIFNGRMGKRWEWYVGTGMNVGFTFDNEMILMEGKYFEPGEHPSAQESLEENRQVYQAKTVHYGRLYIPYGLYYRLGETLSIGIDMRKGIGMQLVGGDDVNFIRRTGSIQLGMKFRVQ